MYHPIRTQKGIALFLALIFECIFAKNQSVGSYFLCSCLRGFTVAYEGAIVE